MVAIDGMGDRQARGEVNCFTIFLINEWQLMWQAILIPDTNCAGNTTHMQITSKAVQYED